MALPPGTRPYLWRMHALAWVWWTSSVAEADRPSSPTAEAFDHARKCLQRLLERRGSDDAGADGKPAVSKHTIDRWFGPTRPRNDLAPDVSLPTKLLEHVTAAIQEGFARDEAAIIDRNLRVRRGGRCAALAEGDPGWERVEGALAALHAPSTVERLLALAPELAGLLDLTFAREGAWRELRAGAPRETISAELARETTFANWDATLPTLDALALAPALAPRHIRVLGLTLARAWDHLTRSLVPSLRKQHPNDAITIELLQLDPEASAATLNPDWPRDITYMRQKIRGELPVESNGGVAVTLRAYSHPFDITGVALGDTFIATFMGVARPARPTMSPYFLVQRGAPGPLGILHAHCEDCWEAAFASSTKVAFD